MMWRSVSFAACLAFAPAAVAQSHSDHGTPASPRAQAPARPLPPQRRAPPPVAPVTPAPAAEPQALEVAPEPTSPPPSAEHAMHDVPMSHHGMGHGTEAGDHQARMAESALGPYPMTRDASGTAWQPDASLHGGVHAMYGDWMVSGHLMLNGVYDWQEGPRGDERAFVAGMAMVSARRDFGATTLQLRAMLSPDAWMGRDGYPLLFAAGETADGVTHLVDRQHPHDLFMELSASLARRFADRRSVFVYAGLPGEPAFGPPAFMHRLSGMDSPEAPISHHYLDSTHITFGVLTLGYVQDDWRVEISGFRGREPDQDRFDIEAPRIDSHSVRVSWNPSAHWSLQASWADLASPEQLHPDEDETRFSASAIYARPVGRDGLWSTTFAFGRRDGEETLDAYLLESAWRIDDRWTVFGRAERVATGELGVDDQIVGRLSLGAVRDFRVADHVRIGVGGLVQHHLAPEALEATYGGDPSGMMAFVRLAID